MPKLKDSPETETWCQNCLQPLEEGAAHEGYTFCCNERAVGKQEARKFLREAVREDMLDSVEYVD